MRVVGNILILRGDIEILPPERTSVSYEFLSQLVGEYLLHASPDVDISPALTMMPLTQCMFVSEPFFLLLTQQIRWNGLKPSLHVSHVFQTSRRRRRFETFRTSKYSVGARMARRPFQPGI